MSNPLYITPNIVHSEYSNQNINSTLLRLPMYNISGFQLAALAPSVTTRQVQGRHPRPPLYALSGHARSYWLTTAASSMTLVQELRSARTYALLVNVTRTDIRQQSSAAIPPVCMELSPQLGYSCISDWGYKFKDMGLIKPDSIDQQLWSRIV